MKAENHPQRMHHREHEEHEGKNMHVTHLQWAALKPDATFDPHPCLRTVEEELTAFGFSVEVERRQKNVETAIESAFIKGETSVNLLRIGAPPALAGGLPRSQLLRVKMEISTVIVRNTRRIRLFFSSTGQRATGHWVRPFGGCPPHAKNNGGTGPGNPAQTRAKTATRAHRTARRAQNSQRILTLKYAG